MSDTVKISINLAGDVADKLLSNMVSKSAAADKNFEKLGKTGSDAFKEISVHIGKSIGVFDIFAGNVAANVATKAFDGLVSGAKALFDVMVTDGIIAAQGTEEAMNALNVALAQSGIYSEETSKRFEHLASEIQDTTTYTDDAVLKNAALIQSMAGLSEKGLERATRAAVELSAAFGKDLSTTSEALAKAANGNVTALQKMGLQFEKGATDAQTFENALTAVEDRFGGTAASKVTTFSGALTNLSNVWQDIQKVVGNAIIQNPVIIEAFTEAGKILRELRDSADSGKGGLQSLVSEGFVFLIKAAQTTLATFDVFLTGSRVIFNALVTTVSAALSSLLYPFTFVSDSIKDIFNGLIEAGKDADSTLKEIFAKGSSLGDLPSTLDRIGKAAEEGFGKTVNASQQAAANLQETRNSVVTLTEEQKKAQEQNNKFADSILKQSENTKSLFDVQLNELTAFYQNREALDTEAEAVNYENKLQRLNEFQDARLSVLTEKLETEKAMIEASNLDEESKRAAQLQLEKSYYAERNKLEMDHAVRSKKILDDQRRFEQKYNEDKIKATADVFGALGSIAALGGKEAFGVMKAFNLAEAISTGWLAIQKAIASAPPPFNQPAILSASVMTAANIARIASQQPPAFAEGGIVGGTSFTGDRVLARVNSGEAILNQRQQKNIMELANGGGGSGFAELQIQFNRLVSVVERALAQPIVVQVSGRELINITRAELASGRSF